MLQKPTAKSTFQALLYLSPMLLVIIVFNIYPIFYSFTMSFYTEYNLFAQEVGAYGIDNYLEIIEDELFLTAIRNTFVFVLGVMPLQIMLSIAIAIMLNKIRYLSSFFRSICFLPFVTSTVVISIVWRWLYHSNYGLVNWFLRLIGVGTISFLTDPEFGMLGLIIMSIWRGLGFNIILFLVGLTNINESYYQAAKIDGAKPFSRFLNITLKQKRIGTFYLYKTNPSNF